MTKLDGIIKIVFLMSIIVLFPTGSNAQEGDLRPVTSTYAIRNATIIQAPGKVIPRGTVVMENGVIKAVGASVSIPANAWIIDSDSMYVYAGFISGMSGSGVKMPKEEDRSNEDRSMRGDPAYERAGITPNQSVRTLLDPSEKSLDEFRKLGFTAGHVGPTRGMMPGTGSIVLFGGSSGEDMLIRENVSLFSQWEGANGVYPSTIMGIMAKYRDMYRKATQALEYSNKYRTSSNGMERPGSDQMLEAMYPVISKQIPVLFKAEEVVEITRALALKKDLGFNLMLSEVKQSWDLVDMIKGVGTPVFLSLDLPEIPEEKKEDESDKDEGSDEEEKVQLTQAEIEDEALKKRKREIVMRYYTQASLLSNQGIRFGFSTASVKSKDFKGNMMKVIENGLTEDQALAALTTTPAQLLGVSTIMGTVEVGKMANVIVTDKPYFEEKSKVRHVFVDGIKYDNEVKEKKKSSGEEDASVIGTWSYTVETPQGNRTGVIDISDEGGSLSGTLTSNTSNEESELEDIEVDGKTLTFSYVVNMGQDMTVNASLEVDGDAFDGNLSIAAFGSFPVEGKREPQF